VAQKKKKNPWDKGYSPNRALGITQRKQKMARETGIPTTKAGLKKKWERDPVGLLQASFSGTGGCFLVIFVVFALLALCSLLTGLEF